MSKHGQVLKHLQSHLTLQIPNPQFIGRPGKDFPYPFHGYKLIAGISAERADVNMSQRIASLKALAEFLCQLHNINPEQASVMGAKVPIFDRSQIAKTIATLYERVQKILVLAVYKINEKEFLQEISLIEHIQLPETDVCLIHGDLYCRHLIFLKQQLTGIIDWGDVAISHKAVDLAVIWSFYPEICHQEFLEIYGVIDPITWQYARFLGLYTGFTLLLYGHAIADTALINEAMDTIQRINPELLTNPTEKH